MDFNNGNRNYKGAIIMLSFVIEIIDFEVSENIRNALSITCNFLKEHLLFVVSLGLVPRISNYLLVAANNPPPLVHIQGSFQ